MIRIKPRKHFRNFIVVYIDNRYKKKIKGNKFFFTFRLNSNNYQPIINRVKRMGFKVTAVYLKSVNRKTNLASTERLA